MSAATGIPDKLWQPPHVILETTYVEVAFVIMCCKNVAVKYS
jgi:hypothetical protein